MSEETMLYFVTSRWTEHDDVIGGDWDSLQSFTLDTREFAVIASKGELVVPDGYRSAWPLDLLAVSDDGGAVFATVGFEREGGSVEYHLSELSIGARRVASITRLEATFA